MIGKLKKIKSLSTKIGKSEDSENLEYQTFISAPEISGVNGAQIEQILSIGSEIGDLILDHEDVSPRHCTFTLNNNILSLMDHSSQQGTFINKKQISPGRVYILNESDKIKLGDLNLIIEQVEVEAPIEEELLDNAPEIPVGIEEDEEEIPELPPTSKVELSKEPANEGFEEADDVDELIDHVDEDEFDDLEEIDDEPIKSKKSFLSFLNKRKKTKTSEQKFDKFNNGVKSVSSTLSRFFALLNDVLIAGVIYEIFSVYDDFYNGLHFLPSQLNTHGQALIEEYSAQLLKIYPDIPHYGRTLLDSEYFHLVLAGGILFMVLRLLGTLLMGVSFGQLLMGMKGHGNPVVKRFMGVVREIIGMVTFPFLIFDLPAIFSRKTFKELMTGTAVQTRSSFLSILSGLLLTPILALIFMYSPLYKGLEYNDSVKVKINVSNIKPIKTPDFNSFSKRLNFGMVSNDEMLSIPTLGYQIKNNKRVARAGMLIFDKKNKSLVEFKLLKKFSLHKVFKEYVRNNPVSYFTHPQVLGAIDNTGKKAQKKFQSKSALLLQKKAIEQQGEIIVSAFGLDFYSLFDHTVKFGPMLRGHRYLRDVMNSLYDNPVLKMEVVKVADKVGILTTHTSGKKPYYAFIPLGYKEAYVYTFSRNPLSKKNIPLFKKITFSKGEIDKKNSSAEFIDSLGSQESNIELDQKLYESYFAMTKTILLTENKKQLKQIEIAVSRLLTYLEGRPEVNEKLNQNLSELIRAIKEKDFEFFNIMKVKAV